MKKIIVVILGILIVGTIAIQYDWQGSNTNDANTLEVTKNEEVFADTNMASQEEDTPPSQATESQPLIELSKIEKNYFQSLRNNVLDAGLPMDGIPPIDDPIYKKVSKVNIKDHIPIFVLEINDEIYLYPQNILVWHEIVNDTIGGESLSITYCPLTGSAICYQNFKDNTFGTSGKLLNSNLLMYDRKTESYIPQILGIGISDQLIGQPLKTRPIHWTTWKVAKKLYPDAKVLSQETGFIRDYTRDPYGVYKSSDEKSYYYNGGPLFDIMNGSDKTFSDKTVVVGVKYEDQTVAILPSFVKEKGLHNFTMASMDLVAFYDYDLDSVRVFKNPNSISFTIENKIITDSEDNIWTYKGISSLATLEPITYFDVMWFAWHAFYPQTEVIQ